mmetsp:Transcript_45964/g.89802  ORF Transcript_45964/g.89802 Transcript_45964/m.89802 type:complete len:87 (+) Transcript_45964:195-455(+)
MSPVPEQQNYADWRSHYCSIKVVAGKGVTESRASIWNLKIDAPHVCNSRPSTHGAVLVGTFTIQYFAQFYSNDLHLKTEHFQKSSR